jgi:uncharacterized membrane protein YraQ (UPF0718 family)
MRTVEQAASHFWSLSWTVVPWLAVGLLAAAAIQAFVPDHWAQRALGGRSGLWVGVGAGALAPGCSRTTMPLAMGLRGKSGVGLGSLVAFVFVSPLLSPITLVLTWSVLGWRLAVGRLVAALAGAALLGTVINRAEPWFDRRGRRIAPIMGADQSANACCDPDPAPPPSVTTFLHELVGLARRMLPYFTAGMLLAALVAAMLPENAIAHALGGSSGLSVYLLAAVVGIPLYVCQGEEVPMTYAVIATGVAPGPALTFLLGAVGSCIPTVLMSSAVFTRRVAACYVCFWLAFVIAAGLTFQAAL